MDEARTISAVDWGEQGAALQQEAPARPGTIRPPHRQHGVAYMLRKLLTATVLVASMATPTASHALADLWDSKGEVVPESEAPERKRGLWKRSYRLPAENPSEPDSALTKPRISSESVSAPQRLSTLVGTRRIVLQSPCLSILGPCI